MLEDLYSIYLPRKSHPWCYLSLEINPANIDVNVHPTKHEVRFLHEDTIIQKVKDALDAKLVGNSASRTFYAQARLPQVDITKQALEEVLPEYSATGSKDKTTNVYAYQMVRTDSADQKLEKFNFTVNRSDNVTKKKSDESVDQNSGEKHDKNKRNNESEVSSLDKVSNDSTEIRKRGSSFFSNLMSDYLHESIEQSDDTTNQSAIGNEETEAGDVTEAQNTGARKIDAIGDSAAGETLKRVYQYLGNRENIDYVKTIVEPGSQDLRDEETTEQSEKVVANVKSNSPSPKGGEASGINKSERVKPEFKSYSVNNSRREVKLTSVLRLRKNVEDNYHEGLRDILSKMIFVGCIDQNFSLIQSGLNLYICNTPKLA